MDSISPIIDEYKPRINSEKIFFLPNLPDSKVENALKKYAIGAKDEQIIALIDEGRNGEDGVLLTDKKVYAHNFAGDPTQWALNTIQSVEFEKGGKLSASSILVNDERLVHLGLDKETVRLFAEMLDKIAIVCDEKNLRQLTVQLYSWEQWQQERQKFLEKWFNQGLDKGGAGVTLGAVLLIILGIVGLCGGPFGWKSIYMVLIGIGLFFGWGLLAGFIRERIYSKEQKTELDVLINDSDPGERSNAAYWLSVIDAKGAIPHLEKILSEEDLNPVLKEYVEKSLEKLRVSENDDSTKSNG